METNTGASEAEPGINSPINSPFSSDSLRKNERGEKDRHVSQILQALSTLQVALTDMPLYTDDSISTECQLFPPRSTFGEIYQRSTTISRYILG